MLYLSLDSAPPMKELSKLTRLPAPVFHLKILYFGVSQGPLPKKTQLGICRNVSKLGLGNMALVSSLV